MSQISQIYFQLQQTTKTSAFQDILTNVGRCRSYSQAAELVFTDSSQNYPFINQAYVQILNETMKILNNIYETYEKRSDKEAAKRQAYESKKLIQYKNGVQIPSKNITVLKYQSAYTQNQFKEQTCRYMDQISKKIGNKFQIFSTLQISMAADMDMVWRQFQKFVER